MRPSKQNQLKSDLANKYYELISDIARHFSEQVTLDHQGRLLRIGPAVCGSYGATGHLKSLHQSDLSRHIQSGPDVRCREYTQHKKTKRFPMPVYRKKIALLRMTPADQVF